jgi:polyhydroxybutyrate depolymerase
MNKRYLLAIFALFFALQPLFSQPHTPGLHTTYMRYGGLDRKYMYYIPAGYNPKAKTPLVFFIHGAGASAQIAVDVVGPQFNARAERDKAIVIYPDGVNKRWNDMLGVAGTRITTVDDVGFLSSLIDVFVKDYKCDPNQVYVSGSSNGGMMTYRLSVDIPDKITAIAPFVSYTSPYVAAQYPKAPPIPIIITVGTADPSIKYEGGPRGPGAGELFSADKNLEHWIARNGTRTQPEITNIPDLDPNDKSTAIKYVYPGKNPVVFYKVVGGMHQHPSIKVGTKALAVGQNGDYNSFETVWDFMTAFKK